MFGAERSHSYILLTNFAEASDNRGNGTRHHAHMKTISLIAFGVVVAVFSNIVSLPAQDQSAGLEEQAISSNQSAAQKAQDQLREAGPQGLEMLESHFANEILEHRSGGASNERWARISRALDRVGGQYDNYASGLYWYTDLEKAKAAAKASGKPILSLRLLGRLDEDLSCANSRFFRTTLYPSVEINQLFKQRFILHWESVRPAPRVTISFGDGRKLERTITGNSIHYVLDPDGKVADALPGLYSARIFAAELRRAADMLNEAQAHGVTSYASYMKSTQDRLLKSWSADLSAIRPAPSANQPITESNLEQLMDDTKWEKVAQLHLNDVYFDGRARELMARKLPASPTDGMMVYLPPDPTEIAPAVPGKTAPGPKKIDARVAAKMAVSKSAVEIRMLQSFGRLSNTVILDTVRNNYMLRTKILEFLSNQNTQAMSLADINNWVYASVFLTPREDPWLGLNPPDVFSAIDKNGETASLK